MPPIAPAAAPYSLAPERFPFPALAALAARTAAGTSGDVVLACLLAARLAASVLPDRPLPFPTRTARGAAARAWFASRPLPPELRIPLAHLADATGEAAPGEVSGALRTVAAAAGPQLDAPAAAELARLIAALGESDDAPGAP